MSRIVQIEKLEVFLPLLAEKVSKPDAHHPTVRVWRDTELTGIIAAIAKEHRAVLKSTFPPAKAVVQQLERLGWLKRLPVHDEIKGRVFFLMEQEAAKDVAIDPLEVLQAALPSGIISYFAAVSFHELTTQTPTFFHVGRLAKGMQPEFTPNPTPTDRNPLGTKLFDYDGAPFYESKRFEGLTVGVQLRAMGPRTLYRITTVEQTLLDTILQPRRCGGEAVVLEAWSNALGRADFEKMAELLVKIGRDSLVRRVGAMLEIQGIELRDCESMQSLLGSLKQTIHVDAEVIPLLPGFDYTQPNENWKVLVP